MSNEEVKKKRISGEAYDRNKQMIHVALKSKKRIKGELHRGARTGTPVYVNHG